MKYENTCRIALLMYDFGKFEYLSVISATAPISLSHLAFSKICVKRIFAKFFRTIHEMQEIYTKNTEWCDLVYFSLKMKT